MERIKNYATALFLCLVLLLQGCLKVDEENFYNLHTGEVTLTEAGVDLNATIDKKVAQNAREFGVEYKFVYGDDDSDTWKRIACSRTLQNNDFTAHLSLSELENNKTNQKGELLSQIKYVAYCDFSGSKEIAEERTFLISFCCLTAKPNNSSYGMVSGSGYYVSNTEVTITATPKENYYFTGWSDCDSKELTRTVQVNSDTTIIANFAKKLYLTVKTNNNYGTVTGSGYYEVGSETTITATPKENCYFIGWSDSDSKELTRIVQVNSDTTIIANFAKKIITKIESVTWLDMEGNSTDSYEITTETKSSPAPTELSVLALPSAIDHLVGGFRFGIVGKDATLDNSVVGSSISNEYISLHTLADTKNLGSIGIRGLKAGTVKIWVEIGDAGLGGSFTVEEYGEPKRAELTINIASVITSVDIYNEGESSVAIGTNNQTMTVGDTRVFEAKITDEEAHSLFKGNVVWETSGNAAGYISVVPDPSDPSKVTVTALKQAKGNAAPKLYAKVTDSKGKETISAMFPIEVEEASNLEFTSASVRWEDFYYFGSDYYTYVFTTAAGDELVIPASDPDMMGLGYNAYMFDVERTWTIGENGDEDIFIMSGPGIGITISASGTEYRIKRGIITISGGGTSASIDLIAVPVVGGVEGTETPVTGTWSGTKPKDPRP